MPSMRDAAPLAHRELLLDGPRLPAGLRAVRPGLPLPLPGRGRPDAARAAPASFAAWLARVPARDSPRTAPPRWLAPGVVTDPTDPKLAHLDGLNLSRAWMLRGIARGLPPGPAARRRCGAARAPPRGRPARRHRRALRGRPLAGHVRRLPRDGREPSLALSPRCRFYRSRPASAI